MKTIGFVCVVIITIAVVAFGSAYKEREQEQNENVKEPMPLIPEDAENSVQESIVLICSINTDADGRPLS